MAQNVQNTLTVLWFICLPFLSRLWRGPDWMMSYLPDDGKLVAGLLFFGVFSTFPAIVCIANAKARTPLSGSTRLLILLVMSVLTALAHYDYDLASDAQAAIWLVIAPIYIAFVGALLAAVCMLLRWLWTRRKLKRPRE